MIDNAFLKFLRTKKDTPQIVPAYLECPNSAKELYRAPYMAAVWWARQEYDNTERYRENLLSDIETQEDKLASLRVKLGKANERPASSIPKGPFFALECAKGHPLVDGEPLEMSALCHICQSFQAEIPKSCSICGVNACARCVRTYSPEEDMGLLAFLPTVSTSASMYGRMRLEKDKPKEEMEEIQRRLSMKSFQAEFNAKREEFYDTEQHRKDLAESIKALKKRIAAMKRTHWHALLRRRFHMCVTRARIFMRRILM